ncbi:MAG: PQQ-binding-like beta-propeller repeat protein [Hyphomicrobiales bacterium]|nr:PQQ-binding-like beta-propeller repeat protein [Hyphomicrobiales bacterium]
MRFLRLPCVLLTVAILSACASWFEEEDGEPLEGTRVSVMAHQAKLLPDVHPAGAAIDLGEPRRNSDWPQEGGFADHTMGHLTLPDTLKLRWSASIGDGIDESRPRIPAPIVADGRVFTMDTEHEVRAFDVETGRVLWDVDLADDVDDDDTVPGGLAFAEGRVYVTTGFAKIIALEAETGEKRWDRSVDAPIHGPPAVYRGRVFAIDINNALYAFDALDGAELWPAHQAIAESAGLLGSASPAVADDIVTAPFSSGDLVALRTNSGRVIWTDTLASTRRTDELSSLTHIRGRPVIDQGLVYAVSYAGVIAAINVRTGERVWEREVGGLYGPWLVGNVLYLLTGDQRVVCMSRSNGSIYWVSELPLFEYEKEKEDPIQWAGPVVAGNKVIVVGSNSRAIALSPFDGKQLERMSLSGPVSHVPVIADGRMYIVTDDGELISYQ